MNPEVRLPSSGDLNSLGEVHAAVEVADSSWTVSLDSGTQTDVRQRLRDPAYARYASSQPSDSPTRLRYRTERHS